MKTPILSAAEAEQQSAEIRRANAAEAYLQAAAERDALKEHVNALRDALKAIAEAWESRSRQTSGLESVAYVRCVEELDAVVAPFFAALEDVV